MNGTSYVSVIADPSELIGSNSADPARWDKNLMVRKGGLEPPCLSAPPPQDGVSANFTTSAQEELQPSEGKDIIADRRRVLGGLGMEAEVVP